MANLTNGACVGLPPEWWIQIDGGLNNARARNICNTICTIRDKCKTQTEREIAKGQHPYGQIRHGVVYDETTGEIVPPCACGNLIARRATEVPTGTDGVQQNSPGPVARRCGLCQRIRHSAQNTANAQKRRAAKAAAAADDLLQELVGQETAA